MNFWIRRHWTMLASFPVTSLGSPKYSSKFHHNASNGSYFYFEYEWTLVNTRETLKLVITRAYTTVASSRKLYSTTYCGIV